ncbi:TetR family transcriptional regulator [Motilibacter rhizosphaerae]|uniref:TetR family transcriptional regulator n=1 Tax=Motilibacter rhizosphaerae TaxID=598652 RepID=A0A4Q7NBB8_9ACTN|nr:TetR family transcriptional regulator [Motilibacter rhizosphaerae]RZS80153.1 TetR family transcriptional regulator [Motilibacter rhizosphaerae]
MAGRTREPLNRERVLRAAVALADDVGIAGVSMRRLAQDLGVVPMALYKHVADKEQLLDGMVDAVIAEFAVPEDGLGWKDAVRGRVTGARAAVLRHPWARTAIETRTRRSPAVLGHMDAVSGAFFSGGLSADLVHHLMHTLGNRIWGFSPELFDAPEDGPGRELTEAEQQAMATQFAQQFPHILQIAVAATGGDLSGVGGGCDEEFEFAFALDLVLDAAERLHRAGWSSRARETAG